MVLIPLELASHKGFGCFTVRKTLVGDCDFDWISNRKGY